MSDRSRDAADPGARLYVAIVANTLALDPPLSGWLPTADGGAPSSDQLCLMDVQAEAAAKAEVAEAAEALKAAEEAKVARAAVRAAQAEAAARAQREAAAAAKAAEEAAERSAKARVPVVMSTSSPLSSPELSRSPLSSLDLPSLSRRACPS